MATTATVTSTSDSRYKSFMKPVKFWSKSSSQPKESSIDDLINKDYMSQNGIQQVNVDSVEPLQQQHQAKSGYLSSFHFGRKSSNNSNTTSAAPIVALMESGKSEVYKLSTIDNITGVYMPPSPSITAKRDHWVEVNEDDMMDFHLPDSACLTTHVGEKHDFYTPSTFVQSQPYILPITDMSDSTLSYVPSLEDGNSEVTSPSCRSSASYL